ncbi:g-patch domain-containing protein [Hirsutella rhossiliensis]|uniref:Pre-mRNA-splicing factor n=1 Tax=Hirsutella rhossiliensis TaxID=111463 RepID=A0A9P8MTU5_9HYPO|nr:g-patch domain-containing protein [Hirsutella rhossiliensis]KAH0959097.1 g-patch domain-containing protein [Hirsutella rhossiliensis]
MSDHDKGRVAIKFAPAPLYKKPPPRSGASSTLGKRPRPHAFGGHDSDSDNDEHRHHRGQHEFITGFGVDGAETERERRDKEAARREFIIQRQPNRDWRTEVKAQKRGKNLLPEEARQQQNGHVVEREPADQDKEIQWGLTVKENKTEENHDRPASSPREESPAKRNGHSQQYPTPARTADEEAMDALLGRTPTAKKTIIQPPLNEDDAYRRDAAAAGAESTLDDYEAMPVEEFGAALLRGMGWNGEPRGPKPKEARRRANRLGLGAKELKESEDLGGWDQKGGKKKRPRLDEYRREESRRKESRRNEDSYKRERERERDGYRERDRERDRQRDRHRDHDRDRRR